MTNIKDPYQILGVSKNATQDQIKNAYRTLAKKFHPDLNPGNKESEAKFKSISAAYELIGDPETRSKYDKGETPEQMEAAAREYARRAQENQSYYQTQQGPEARYSSQFSGPEAEEFFENLFRSANSGRSQRSRRVDFPGEDLFFHMEVDFKDAARGVEREITIPSSGKKLSVKIPAGIENGAKLRFRGQGSPGIGKGPPGDIYVEIQIRPLEGFARNGLNIETELPISFIEAIVGAEISVNTIDGPVLLTIPSGVSTGTRLRIRGKGISKKDQSGDQFVTLKVVMPKKIDPELKSSIANLKEKFSYNPRSES